MDIDRLLRTARRDAGCSLRALAERAGTSHSALAAYESRSRVPRADTLLRILEAAGQRIAVTRDPDFGFEARVARGKELEQVLGLAGHFPARHDVDLHYPRFAKVADGARTG